MKPNATNFISFFPLTFLKKSITTLFILFYGYQLFTHPLDNRMQTFIYTLNLGRNLIQLLESDPKSSKKTH